MIKYIIIKLNLLTNLMDAKQLIYALPLLNDILYDFHSFH